MRCTAHHLHGAYHSTACGIYVWIVCSIPAVFHQVKDLAMRACREWGGLGMDMMVQEVGLIMGTLRPTMSYGEGASRLPSHQQERGLHDLAARSKQTPTRTHTPSGGTSGQRQPQTQGRDKRA